MGHGGVGESGATTPQLSSAGSKTPLPQGSGSIPGGNLPQQSGGNTPQGGEPKSGANTPQQSGDNTPQGGVQTSAGNKPQQSGGNNSRGGCPISDGNTPQLSGGDTTQVKVPSETATPVGGTTSNPGEAEQSTSQGSDVSVEAEQSTSQSSDVSVEAEQSTSQGSDVSVEATPVMEGSGGVKSEQNEKESNEKKKGTECDASSGGPGGR